MVSSGVQGRLVHQLKRAEQALRAVIDEALAPLGVTGAQYGALAALDAAPGVTSAELARACLVSAQSMHELVTGLAERGLVDRERRDGRSVRLAVSTAGHAVLRAADPLVDHVERELVGTGHGPADLRTQLAALVDRLRERPSR